MLSSLVDDETGAGITSSARRNLKLTPGNREQRREHQDALRGIGVQTNGRTRRGRALWKKRKSLDPPLSGEGGWGRVVFVTRGDEIERRRRNSRDIDIVCTRFLLYGVDF